MYRYCAFVWDETRAGQAAKALSLAISLRARGFTQVFSARGASAFDVDSRPSSRTIPLSCGCGAIFGTLFRTRASSSSPASPPSALETLTDVESRAIADDSGYLLRRYWGRYVALLRTASTTRILRDPTGTLPCFHLAIDGVQACFSDIEDILPLTAARLEVNWDYVGAFVAGSAGLPTATGLRGVTELRPGECIEWAHGQRRSFMAWNPHAVVNECEPRNHADLQQTAQELRDTTLGCVQAWASCYPRIVHSLSGGLDSSIVLACLRRIRAEASVVCLNHHGTRPDEDERRYARLVAHHAGVELVEQPLDPARADLRALLSIRRSPVLSSYIGGLQRRAAETRLARKRGAQSIFSGAGGDGLFYQARPELAVADYVHERGIRRQVVQVALDAARISQRAVWPLLVSGIRAGVCCEPANEPGPGKRWQILSLCAAPSSEEVLGERDDPERTHPLISQPLVELCLRIPTYVLLRGGWDRALARKAFAQWLPPRIVRRRAKGHISAFSQALLDTQADFVRDLLLGGILVKERILDRKRIERCLSGKEALSDRESSELVHTHLSAEAWLRTWLPA